MIIRNIRQVFRKMSRGFNLSEFEYSQSNKSRFSSKGQKSKNQLEQDESEGEKSKKVSKIKKDTHKRLEYESNPIEVLQKIVSWRKIHLAPVDELGCERLADRKAPIQIQKYQLLISLMLSVQTKDQTTSICVNRLKNYGLTPVQMSKISEQKLKQMIYECNFNRRKAKNIIEVSKLVLQNGLATTKVELLKYPGVGIKIAMIYLKVAEGKIEGIGVDTHVHRICNKLGWVATSDPVETEAQLQKLFPYKYWQQMNIAFVGFGQTLCTAKKPMCEKCPVTKQCPSSSLKNKTN